MSFINNKKFQPVLIVMVLFLWFYIGYRVFESMSLDDDVLEPVALNRVTRLSESDKEAIWTSQFDFRDPFVQSKIRRKKSVKQKKPVIVEKKGQVLKPVFRLNIKFSGLVKDSNRNQQLAMLIYNGKTILAEEGLEIERYKLTSMTPDSVIFRESNNEYVIRR